MNRPLLLLLLPFALAACEQLGIDDPVKVAEKREAEGRAVGSGCRHVGMSLQDCYDKNRKESKAAIFAGWREMDGYMRENKIDTVKAGGEEEEAAAESKADKGDKAAEATESAEKPVAKKEKSAAPVKQTSARHRDGSAPARHT
jgi:hypothetical protein